MKIRLTSARARVLFGFAMGLLSLLVFPARGLSPEAPNASPKPTVSIRDAIGMVRIPQYVGPVATFSPDGSRFAAVSWHGDLERNVNVYDLLVFRSVGSGKEKRFDAGQRIATLEFAGDTVDQAAVAIGHLTFLRDNRTVVFLGRQGESPAQVYSVDAETRELRKLTDHPSAVVNYAIGPDGSLRLFSAMTETSEEKARIARIDSDAVFLSDPTVFPSTFSPGWLSTGGAMHFAVQPSKIREYLVPKKADDGRLASTKWFDTQQLGGPRETETGSITGGGAVVMRPAMADYYLLNQYPSLTTSPTGRQAILSPWSFAKREKYAKLYSVFAPPHERDALPAGTFGLIDLETQKITELIDAPGSKWADGDGEPVWSPDGKSVLVHALLPVEGDEASRKVAAAGPVQWIEVDLATRRVAPLRVAPEWRAVRWNRGDEVILTNASGAFASISRAANGRWGAVRVLGTPAGFNAHYDVATNGEVVIGVRDDLTTAPELAAYDLRTGKVSTLTDLNPALRQRRYGETTVLHWKSPHDPGSFGYLVKPLDYVAGKRYPVVVIWTDQKNRENDRSFILDAPGQPSGYAIQSLAAGGLMVLMLPDCPSLDKVVETPDELVYQTEHFDAALAELDRLGLSDPKKIAVTGWSRAAFMTDYLVTHSSYPFAAASRVEGDGRDIIDGGKPWRTDQIARIRAPYLMEVHGKHQPAMSGPMYDEMLALGKPVEMLYISAAPHATTRPLHRFRSLTAHTDWFRFWLQGYEDPDPAKAAQYERWRRLRELQSRKVTSPPAS